MAGRRTVGAQSNTGIARLEAGVYRAIVEVFNREFTNPELDPLTITRVALTRDGSLVRVYFADGRLAPFAEPCSRNHGSTGEYDLSTAPTHRPLANAHHAKNPVSS